MSRRPENFLPFSEEMSGFLQAIKADPTNDGHRLIFADWLEENGDPRGTLIRLQCEIAQLPLMDCERKRLREQEQAHLAVLRDWVGLSDSEATVRFQRGLLAVHPRSFPDAKNVANSDWWPWVESLELSDGWSWSAAPFNLRKLLPLFRTTTSLAIHRHQLTSVSDFLASLGPLTSLTLTMNHLQADNARELFLGSQLSHLVELALNQNPLSNSGVLALTKSPHLTRLRSLEVHTCELHLGGAKALTTWVGLSGLQKLRLGGNAIGDEGIVALAHSPHLGEITWLGLSRTSLGDEGVKALAGSSQLRRLTFLGLGDNPRITNGGAKALAESPHLGNLAMLGLGGCGLTSEGKAALQRRFGEQCKLIL